MFSLANLLALVLQGNHWLRFEISALLVRRQKGRRTFSPARDQLLPGLILDVKIIDSADVAMPSNYRLFCFS
ncbi:MAG TPA: hypothetical protein VL155_13790, partial [Terriglobales bacterium]|nr:hypothetical protein [Terriglobales bacterium]